MATTLSISCNTKQLTSGVVGMSNKAGLSIKKRCAAQPVSGKGKAEDKDAHAHNTASGTHTDVPCLTPIPTRPSTFAVHYTYTKAIAEHVKNLRVRDKRNIYVAMRLPPDVKTDSFLPHFGLSVADFCVWQTLNEKPRQTTT